jgi:adenylate cyclase
MLTTLRTRTVSTARKLLAVFNVATLCTLGALLLSLVPGLQGVFETADTAFYDAFYKLREPQSKLDAPIVIVAVDQDSIDRMKNPAPGLEYRWPWPRELWGVAAQYLQECGAKAVVFDLFFDDPSYYNRESGDDSLFAEQLNKLTIPVIYSWRAPDERSKPCFAGKLTTPPRLGAVNVIGEVFIRDYQTMVGKSPSLAAAALQAINHPLPAWSGDRFLLHYYGPNKRIDGQRTFHYEPAANLMIAMFPNSSPQLRESMRQIFRDKIVLIGATADATFDLKGAPVSRLYPGVEAHATAVLNLIENRKVEVVGRWPQFALTWLAALLATIGAVMLRSVLLKVPASLAGLAMLFAAAYWLFVSRPQIYWLPLAAPLLAAGSSTIVGMAWTYLVEDRRRRVLLKFLAQFVSPDVAAELNRRGEVSLGGVRREMTVLFTDIAGFTDLSEQLPVEQLEKFMNFYLSELSAVVFKVNGTLDKYIGDAIMAFWNAPLDQPEHAVLACRAALGMRLREQAMRQQLAAFGALGVYTRIGINSGPMVVGNLGSMQKLNYTVLGDSVNLASRLEGANKIYGTRILVAEPTVRFVNGQFLFRKLDLLRVKGRQQPMPVYELVAEGPGDTSQQRLVADFETALSAYQKMDWETAERILVALAADFPDDKPSVVLLNRVRAFRSSPPPRNWDGVHEAQSK